MTIPVYHLGTAAGAGDFCLLLFIGAVHIVIMSKPSLQDGEANVTFRLSFCMWEGGGEAHQRPKCPAALPQMR
jgi:hypothetical protein